MSKSLARASRAPADLGLAAEIVKVGAAPTAQEAADAVGCALDQIAKSVVLGREDCCALFLTAGGNRVDGDRASALAGGPLTRADADTVRAVTGFAIGGASPVGHLTPVPT